MHRYLNSKEAKHCIGHRFLSDLEKQDLKAHRMAVFTSRMTFSRYHRRTSRLDEWTIERGVRHRRPIIVVMLAVVSRDTWTIPSTFQQEEGMISPYPSRGQLEKGVKVGTLAK